MDVHSMPSPYNPSDVHEAFSEPQLVCMCVTMVLDAGLYG